jgi:hypothetical protein
VLVAVAEVAEAVVDEDVEWSVAHEGVSKKFAGSCS